MVYRLSEIAPPLAAHDDRVGVQARPALAPLADGGAIAVWETGADEEVYGFGRYDVVGRIHDATGAPVGEAFLIDAGDGRQGHRDATVTGLEGGGFAVAVGSDNADALLLRTYDADGALLNTHSVGVPPRTIESGGREFTVQPGTGGGPYTLAALEDGGVALTFEAGYAGILAQYAGASTNYSQVFDGSGEPLATPAQISPWIGSASYGANWPFTTILGHSAGLSDGGYVVVARVGSETPGGGDEDWSIGARLFDAQGRAVGDFFPVNPETSVTSQSVPQVLSLGDGRYAVSWSSSHSGAWQGYVRLFDEDGTPLGREVEIAPEAGFVQGALPMGLAADGGFVVLLPAKEQSNGPVYVLNAQRFDAEGRPVGEGFIVQGRSGDLNLSYFTGGQGIVTLGDGTHFALYGISGWDDAIETDVYVHRFFADRVGGPGDDLLTAADGATTLYALAGDDTLRGSPGDDTLLGDTGDDRMIGGAGDDRMEGQADADVMFGNQGRDAMSGALGHDYLHGGVGADFLTGYHGNDTLVGFDGDDRLHGQAGWDRLDGGDGDDVLSGGAGNDVLLGRAGADRMLGAAGDDWMSGEAGDDVIFGNQDADSLFGGLDDDYLNGGLGDDLLLGAAGADTLVGEDGADRLSGADGDDRLVGGADDDRLDGGVGADTGLGGTGDDVMLGGQGFDRLWGDAGDDYLAGNQQGDVLAGGAGADTLNGGLGNDLLFGGDGDDRLVGSGGADRFVGGAGQDVMVAGDRSDTFRFFAPAESGAEAPDWIFGFASGEDRIDLRGVDAVSGGGDDAFRFVGAAAFSGTAGEVRFAAGRLEGDVGGDGTADMVIVLAGGALAELDLLL